MKMDVSGTGEFLKKIEKLSNDAVPMEKAALYQGAKIMADAVKAEMQGLRTTENWRNMVAYNMGGMATLSDMQKEGLLTGFGLSKMKYADGSVYLVMGFNGYNNVKTKRWPNGQPNRMIAAVVERGSSFFIAQPFFKRAVNDAKQQAIDAVQTALKNAIANL